MSRTMTTAILAAILGVCILEVPMPASAGSVTLMLTPNGESADLIQQGLRIYSAIEEQKNATTIHGTNASLFMAWVHWPHRPVNA
jgi:hypothetical protein